MDNLTHSLVGAALAEAGPRDRFVLATPTLILAANVPDVDIAAYLIGGEFAALAWRRGITHGVPALILWPVVVAAVMLGWDRYVRRRRDPTAAPARFRPLVVLAAIGAVTHPALDWLNTYGMRWWLPFDGSWSYGDAVFIIDPWLWLLLGGVVFLGRSTRWQSLAGWLILAALTSLLVLGVGMVPVTTKALWVVGLLALAVARWRGAVGRDPVRRRRVARAATAAAGAYVVVMIATAVLAERDVRTGSRALGLDPVDVMTGPRPATLTGRDVIVRTAEHYHLGSWHWSRSPRMELTDAVPQRRGPEPVIRRALADARVRHFLTWSRYPYAHATGSNGEWDVQVGDARYRGHGLGGLNVNVGEWDAGEGHGEGDESP